MGPKPAQPSSKEERIIRGLASIVGLSQGDASNFDVLKTVAETLGCTVALDGTTTLEDDEPNSKRAKLASDADEIEEGEGGSELDHSGPESEHAQVDSGPIAVEDPRTSDEVEGQEGIADGEALFQWMISPVGIDAFEDGIQEQRPLLVRRPKNQGYYRGLFSKEEINRLLHTQRLRYQYNLDVVSYSRSGTRQNFNFNSAKHDESGEGPEMADPGVVWRRFEREDCSLRVLHPQRYCDALWRLLARLEAHLQCNVGCNSYLTPPGSQGFAPHWDDVDVYILQLEGRKRWRLHAPTDPSHILPRFSSRDFTQEEVGECVLQEVLAPGDLLYLPRGTVHQAEALPDCHSLHLTISTNQLRTWADFLGEAIPRALQLAAQEHLVLRRSLPRNYLDFMGVMHEDSDSDSEFEDAGDKKEGSRGHLQALREAFREEALDCMEAVAKCLPLDSTADQLAAQFLKSRLPPLLPASNSGPSTAGPSSGKARPPVITQQSCVRLVMPGIARLVVEDGQDGEPAAMVYHCVANSRHQHASCSTPEVAEGKAGTLQRKQSEVEGQDCPPLPDVHREGKQPADEPCEGDGMEDGVLEFPLECAGTLEALLSSKPGCEVDVADLPSVEDCDIDALGVTQVLADVGLITTV